MESEKYENFINDVLKEELRLLESRLQELNAEINDLIQQKHTIKVITDKKECFVYGPRMLGESMLKGVSVSDKNNINTKNITRQQIHPSGFKAQMNIGCNFFMEASVPDTSLFLMNIGLNHYLEFGIEEGNKYLDARIKAYEKKSEELIEQSTQVKAQIKLILLGIAGFQSKKDSGNEIYYHKASQNFQSSLS